MFNSQVKKEVAELRKQTSQDHVTLRNRLETNIGETRKHEEEIINMMARIKMLEDNLNKLNVPSNANDKPMVFMPSIEKKTIRKAKVKPKKTK